MGRQTFLPLLFLAVTYSAPAVTINLNPNAGLAGNIAALSAFQRAANTWSNLFTDPFSVNIDAGLDSLDPNVIGQANSLILTGPYSTVRNLLVGDALDEPGNSIVGALPTAAQFSASIPDGFGLNGNVLLTQANANALGVGINLGADGSITFNSDFLFDYDNSDGVADGLVDFETVALHEIGHVLGFFSVVDDIDFALANGQIGAIAMSTLDLFRFSNGSIPTNPSEFTNTPRSLLPGEEAVFSDGTQSWRFSTGLFAGDGRQASHWRDDALSGFLIGAMDPTLGSGSTFAVTAADLRAFDLIGYDLNPDVAVPEPAAFALVFVGLAGMVVRRRVG